MLLLTNVVNLTFTTSVGDMVVLDYMEMCDPDTFESASIKKFKKQVLDLSYNKQNSWFRFCHDYLNETKMSDIICTPQQPGCLSMPCGVGDPHL